EHRRSDDAAVVLLATWLVDHRRDDDARIGDRGQAHEARDVLPDVLAVLYLVGGAGLATDAIAGDPGRAGRTLVTHGRLQHLEHLLRGGRRDHLVARLGAFLAQQGERHDLALPTEHRVGAGELQQRHRHAVPVGHGCLLDRPPGTIGSHPAGCRARPVAPMRSGVIASASLAVPTFDDLAMMPVRSSRPKSLPWSPIRQPPIFMWPGEVSMVVPGPNRPESIAAATVKGLIVEPGSKVSSAA